MLRLAAICALVLGTSAALAQQSSQSGAPLPWPPPGVAVPGNGITPPNLLQRIEPKYSYDTIRKRVQGVVALGCVVNEDGSVGTVQVLQSLDPDLDSAAENALKQWRFAPARTRQGSPVAVAIKVSMSFTLRGEPPPGPVLAWPAEFTPPQNVAAHTWIEKTVDADKLRIHVEHPGDWFLQQFANSHAPVLLSVRNGLSTRVVSVRRPLPIPMTLDGPLPQDRLDKLVAVVMQKERADGRKIDISAYGQVMTSSAMWIWMDTHASTSDLPSSMSGLPLGAMATKLFSDVRSWLFVTSVNDEYVVVACTILVPRDATPEQRQAQLQQVGGEFGGIMRRLSIGRR